MNNKNKRKMNNANEYTLVDCNFIPLCHTNDIATPTCRKCHRTLDKVYWHTIQSYTGVAIVEGKCESCGTITSDPFTIPIKQEQS